MKTTVRSPGSATVINAISTGCGSAFGIKLYVTAEVELNGSSGITCRTDREVDTTLMELCVEKVFEKFRGMEACENLDLETGVTVQTSSTLPMASGLSSSSATSNAIVMATVQAILDEYQLEVNKIGINNFDILNMAIDASLDAGVTVTGSFDDASASFFGGLTITDNKRREILQRHVMEEQNILVYMPDTMSHTANSDVRRMKLLSPYVKIAFREALKGNIYSALTLNGFLYCAALGFNPDIALDALDSGATAAGLSGTGPSFVAIADSKNADSIESVWSSYKGRVIRTEVDNDGIKVISSG